jgi:hypothetical protein
MEQRKAIKEPDQATTIVVEEVEVSSSSSLPCKPEQLLAGEHARPVEMLLI